VNQGFQNGEVVTLIPISLTRPIMETLGMVLILVSGWRSGAEALFRILHFMRTIDILKILVLGLWGAYFFALVLTRARRRVFFPGRRVTMLDKASPNDGILDSRSGNMVRPAEQI
jgi:hypothetical protein